MSVVGIGMGKDQRELVATDPKCAVGGAAGADEQSSHRGQQLIATGVAVLVVHALEVVEVNDGERHGCPLRPASSICRWSSSWNAR